MKDEMNTLWGARIERGRVVTVRTRDGRTRYDIASYDRPGVAALNMPGPEDLHVGDGVYFFMFEDGKGRVLCGISD